MLGERFGKLVPVEAFTKKRNTGNTRTIYRCLCDCGRNDYTVSRDNLKYGRITHCGCASPRHHMYNTRLWAKWKGMKDRCLNPNHAAYKNYGARGIEICEEWIEFKGFQAWAMGSGYADELTLERIDNNKGYSPDNCRWATRKEQANNRRCTLRITFEGETLTLTEWAERTGVNYCTLRYRMQAGKPPEQILKEYNHALQKP